MKKRIVLIGLSLCLSIFAGCGQRDESGAITLRVASVLPASHPSSQALVWFKDRLAELSEGKIQVKLFLNSQLGKQTETVELCMNDNLEMVFVSTAPLTQFVPELNAFTMPFIFRDMDHLHRVLDGPIGEEYSRLLGQLGLEVLTFCDSWARSIMTKEGPISTPEQLQGMKIRVMSAPLMLDTVNSLGASALPMSQGDVYTALQTGVLDGWENNPPTALSFKMHETGCIYYAYTEHLIIPNLIIINRNSLEKLDETSRGLLHKVARETKDKQRELLRVGIQEAVEELQQAGMKFNEVDKTLFAGRVESVYEELYERYGAEFKDLCERIKSQP